MNRARAGFDEFVGAHATRLLRYAYLLTADPDAAQDLLQEVLERLFVAWPRVENPLAYARVALARRGADRWSRRRRRQETALTDQHDVGLPDPSALFDERDQILAALAQLGPRQRAVVVLRYLEDLSEADTADMLGISRGTVKSQASRGLGRLRTILVDLHPAVGTGTPACGGRQS